MEEKKPLKIKFKTIVIFIIIGILVLGVLGANVYATTNGYGNVFFLIKYLVTGEKPEISGKDELLSDRDITISYEPINLTENIKIQIRNLQIKDNNAKLLVAVSENKQNETTPLMYKVYNEENKLICEQKSSKEANNETEYVEELILKGFKNDEKILYLEVFNSKNEKINRIIINLELREVTVEGEKEAIQKISEIELKKFLGHVTALEPYKDSDDERILFAGSMFAQKEELNVNKLDELNKMLDATGYERLSNPLKNAQYFKIVNKDETNYIEVTVGRGGFEPNTVIEIKEISYCGGLYTAKFNYAFIHDIDSFNMNHLNEQEIKEATVYFRKNEDTKYSTFKVVKYETTKEKVDNVLIENNELIGSWEPSFAKENDKEISLRDIYGSGLSGTMNFEANGKYTEFIGIYSSEVEDDLQGDYINNKISITLISNSGRKSILTIKQINGEKYIEKETGSENQFVYFKKTSSNNLPEETNLNKIVTQITPSGFAGSSLHRVDLYSNKDVYLITFDGGGFEENNIKSKELIARNVDSISKAEDGDIYIKGGIQVKDGLGWIHFETIDNVSDDEIENEIRNVMGAYIELLGARISDVTAPLYKLDLKYKESNQDAKKIGYNKTNILYSKFKEEMLKYMTEKCFNTEMNADNVYIEEDGFLCHSGGAASSHDYKLKEITKISDKVYQAEVLATLEEDTRIIYFEIGVEKQNGKYVVDYSRQIYN